MRARVLSGEELAFVCLEEVVAFADDGQYLPARTGESFPLVVWIDHGSVIDFVDVGDDFGFGPDQTVQGNKMPERTPVYEVSGFVRLATGDARRILTRGEIPLEGISADVCDQAMSVACRVRIPQQHQRFSYSSPGGGGYWRAVPLALKDRDLLFEASATPSSSLSPRKEQTYVNIIGAMLSLLRHKEGANMPSDAKVITRLIELHGQLDGVGKRKLETVFVEANRALIQQRS